MESIGQILKAARERRQISITDVVAATKMTGAFVKAIEADNFGALVAPVYARGFIKLYAECVGLDPMPLLQQFGADGRAAPVIATPPPKAAPGRALSACADKLKTKTGHAKAGQQAPGVSSTVLAAASSLRVIAHRPIPGLSPSWWRSLLAGRWSALNRVFSARVQWPCFKLPGRMLPCLLFPVMVWRRIFIVAVVVLLVIAASLAWEWSHSELSSTTDACRWLAEPPAPYLSMQERLPVPGR